MRDICKFLRGIIIIFITPRLRENKLELIKTIQLHDDVSNRLILAGRIMQILPIKVLHQSTLGHIASHMILTAADMMPVFQHIHCVDIIEQKFSVLENQKIYLSVFRDQ